MLFVTDLTYEKVICQVKNWIFHNCRNIGDYEYDKLPTCLKNSVELVTRININDDGKAGGTYVEELYREITSGVRKASYAKINSDIDDFIESIGNPQGKISANNFYSFINNVASFCANKLAFAVSETVSHDICKALVYMPNTNYIHTKSYITSNKIDYELARAYDVSMLIYNLFSSLTKREGNIRVVNITGRFYFQRNH